MIMVGKRMVGLAGLAALLVAAPAAAQTAAESREYDAPPRLLKQSRPNYPAEAFRRGIEGTVDIRFSIDEEGRVIDPVVVKSIPELDKAALDCVRKWRFKPAQKDGKVVKSTALAPVTFRITGKAPPALVQGVAESPQGSVTLPAPLARVLADYEAAWQGKDAAALAALFAENGFVLPSGAAPVGGRAQIEKHYAGAGGPLALRAFAFASEGSLGYIIGAYATEKGQPDTGKFTLTLRKGDDGRWLILSDMDNRNTRP